MKKEITVRATSIDVAMHKATEEARKLLEDDPDTNAFSGSLVMTGAGREVSVQPSNDAVEWDFSFELTINEQ